MGGRGHNYGLSVCLSVCLSVANDSSEIMEVTIINLGRVTASYVRMHYMLNYIDLDFHLRKHISK